ncbi:MAG: DUF2254 domain-containing protein [Planctomycetes bacterium]|nr:DUF2254 domain-containing protein [Planctomycetota bacterium]
MFKLRVFFTDLGKHIWPRVTFYAILSVATALLAVVVRDRIPDTLEITIDANTVMSILQIIASSMLAITTFSLTIMVSAYSSATTTVTPRATQLVMADRTTQNVLATFLGSFIFSLAGIIALNTGIYQNKGRLILFVMTMLVVVIIVVTLIRWIEHLAKMGRVNETTKMVECAACESLRERACAPWLGCNPLDLSALDREKMVNLASDKFGYIQVVDVENLSAIADKQQCDLYIAATPGQFVTPSVPLLLLNSEPPQKVKEQLVAAFKIADERAFEQDPRFGLIVLAEIAQRALSDSINDPGTVIDVLNRMVVALAAYAKLEEPDVKYSKVWFPCLDVDDLFRDAFNSVCRDGAHSYEVQARLQRTLGHLAQLDNPDFKRNAVFYSRLAMKTAEKSGLLDMELQDLELRKL